jgi:ubiquinone/menaquinone biosynthesis C-methylase UbiE
MTSANADIAGKAANRPVFAWLYARDSASGEGRGQAEHRAELLAGVEGRVIEVGAGNGLNFRHYPATVTDVVAVEPERHLRRMAEGAAERAPVPVTVIAGDAESLPAGDRSFDVAVVSLVLCSVEEQRTALAEARRVLRPGGELRFYEHVVGTTWPLKAFQVAIEKTFWPRVGGNCHPARDTAQAIRQAGFEVKQMRRFLWRPMPVSPKMPFIIGRARVVWPPA